MEINTLLPKPDLWKARSILVVQPHYDDADIGAGGTLARLADHGAAIYYLTVTDDLVGVVDISVPLPEMSARLKSEQAESGSRIGVRQQFWLGYPDAGEYNYYELRKRIIQHIRMLQPDFLFTVDPFLPYEVHRDHILTGQAASEAALLYGFMRLSTIPEVDTAYEPHNLEAVVYFHTHAPNIYFDISPVVERKHDALRAYRSQFTPEDTEMLIKGVDLRERLYGAKVGCSHAEAIKILNTGYLHCNPDALQA